MGLTASEQDALLHDVSAPSPVDDKYSQASTRFFRIFTDQWGREWGADCEIKTQHPCGPWSMRSRAPLMPPAKYIVITDTIRAKIVIDTRRWIEDLLDAESMYWQEVSDQAKRMGNERGRTMYNVATREVDSQLKHFVGKPPMPIEVLQAMRAGNRWILGLKMPDGSPAPKPDAAPRDYFPDQADLDKADVFAEKDPWGEPTITQEEADRLGGGAEPVITAYPHHYGGGWWLLSAEHRSDFEKGLRPGFKGSRVEAERAAERGEVPESEKPPESVHDSWGEG